MTITTIDAGSFFCDVCGVKIYANACPPQCPKCRQLTRQGSSRNVVQVLAAASEECPWDSVVRRLNPEGLAGLARCRRANCGFLIEHAGNMVCVGRGKSCEWLSLWAAWLNSGRGCENWPGA